MRMKIRQACLNCIPFVPGITATQLASDSARRIYNNYPANLKQADLRHSRYRINRGDEHSSSAIPMAGALK